MTDEKDLYRKIEPISRVLRAVGVPPLESVIPTPAEVLTDLGVPTIEDVLPAIKEDVRSKIRGMR